MNGSWLRGLYHSQIRDLTDEEKELWEKIGEIRKLLSKLDTEKAKKEVEIEGVFRDYG